MSGGGLNVATSPSWKRRVTVAEKDAKEQFYLDAKDEEEEGEVQELTLEDVGVPVIEGKEEEPAQTFKVIGNEEESSTEEEQPAKAEKDAESVSSKRHHHRSHRHTSKSEKEGEKKHRHHHH